MYTFKFDKGSNTAVLLSKVINLLSLKNQAIKNTLDYNISFNVIPVKGLDPAFENYRILHLSDLHIDAIADNATKLFNTIKKLSYNCCVLTGDYKFDAYNSNNDCCKTLMKTLIDKIDKQDGVFVVSGNHDPDEVIDYIANTNAHMLNNSAHSIIKNNARLNIIGVIDPVRRQTHDLAKATHYVTRADTNILLVHSPELVYDAVQYPVDIYLCGHTHGGQMCLPGNIPVQNRPGCERQFISGCWQYQHITGYTSRGVGTTGVTARFYCPPEITVHTLRRFKEPKYH